jgi:hypothetical protein
VRPVAGNPTLSSRPVRGERHNPNAQRIRDALRDLGVSGSPSGSNRLLFEFAKRLVPTRRDTALEPGRTPRRNPHRVGVPHSCGFGLFQSFSPLVLDIFTLEEIYAGESSDAAKRGSSVGSLACLLSVSGLLIPYGSHEVKIDKSEADAIHIRCISAEAEHR